MIIAYWRLDFNFSCERKEELPGKAVLEFPARRMQYPKGAASTGQVHEGQAPEYGGTRLRHTYPVHGPEEDQ